MKQFLEIKQNKKLLLTLLLSISFIWLLGPYLAIAGKEPLASLTGRLLASLVAIAGPLILAYWRSRDTALHPLPLPGGMNELQSLQNKLQQVLNALHKNPLTALIFRYRKPWYLVLGPTLSGKSTLLQKADFSGAHSQPSQQNSQKECGFWLTDEAVFIDVAGRYLQEKQMHLLPTSASCVIFFKYSNAIDPAIPLTD